MRGVARRVGLSLLCGVVVAAALFSALPTARAVRDDWRMRAWPKVEARVIESQVERAAGSDVRYRFRVAYVYEIDGRTWRATRVRPGYDGSADVAPCERLATAYPVGAVVQARANPAHAAEATLRLRDASHSLVLVIPLLFVAAGCGGIAWAWRRPATPRALSDAGWPAARSARIATVVFAVLVVAGSAGSWFLLVRPLARLIDARSWPSVPCTVVSSEVRERDSGDGTTYSVEILYRYEWAGRSWLSNRYGFLGGSSSGHAGKAEIVRRYPPGSSSVCWIDPRQPEYAVLQRSFRAIYLVGLFPLALAGVGLSGLVRPRRGARSTSASLPAPECARSGERTLDARHAPTFRVVASLVFALVWNGIVGVFLWSVARGWVTGAGSIVDTLFLLPFVLVGIASIGVVAYQALAAANPRPTLVVRGERIEPGARLDLEWRLAGAATRLAALRIALVGREEATYTRGTRTCSARETFVEATVFESDSPAVLPQGRASFTIPANGVPTFDAPHNKVEWLLVVHGPIAHGPDVEVEFPIQVEPRRQPVREMVLP